MLTDAPVTAFSTEVSLPKTSRAHLRRAGPDGQDVNRERGTRPLAGKMNARVTRLRRPGSEPGGAP